MHPQQTSNRTSLGEKSLWAAFSGERFPFSVLLGKGHFPLTVSSGLVYPVRSTSPRQGLGGGGAGRQSGEDG